VKGIVIRGISDLLENKEGADDSGSQPLAARNAAAFFAEMLALVAQERIQTADATDAQPSISATQHTSNTSTAADLLQNRDWRNSLAKTLTDLYEQGPGEQGGAWKRAGGKTHFMSNSSSVQAQWHTAVERLAQGGAGDITLTSLFKAVKEEFGDNLVVRQLCQEAGII
jgi:adenosylhomocysteine nucleosidase